MRLPLYLIFILFFAAPVSAQQVAFGGLANDPKAPVEVTADELSVDQETGKAVFSGNVVIGQGALRLSAGRVEVVYGSGDQRIDRMIASGGVTLVNGQDAAEAERAEYSITDNSVVMRGNVLVTQGPNALTADAMTLNLATGRAEMSGRVKTLLNTGQN